MTPSILPERLARFQAPTFTLDRGVHPGFKHGHCATEAADWLTGGEACIAVDLRRLLQTLNDRWDTKPRQQLKPYVVRALGTKGDRRSHQRARTGTEWLLHHSLPDWMEQAGCPWCAKALREASVEKASAANIRWILANVRARARRRRLMWPSPSEPGKAWADGVAAVAQTVAAAWVTDAVPMAAPVEVPEPFVVQQQAAVLDLLDRLLPAHPLVEVGS